MTTKTKYRNMIKAARSSDDDLLAEKIYEVAQAIPNIVNNVLFPAEDFRGLIITQGQRGGYLAIAKIYDKNGIPSICFANGATPFEALMAIEIRVGGSHWKDDTRAEDFK